MDQKRTTQVALQKGYAQEFRERLDQKLAEIREQLVTAQLRLKKLKSEYQATKESIRLYPVREKAIEKALATVKKYSPDNPVYRIKQLSLEIEKTKTELKAGMRAWKTQRAQV
jgi:predicted  nucleic acid-binding Zn-ribbon protein